MSQFYAYLYSDPSKNNEPIYAGKGQNKRAWDHLKRTDHRPLTYRIQKMVSGGITPLIKLFKAESEELAFLIEEELISLYGRKDLMAGSLLNLSNGGEGGASGMIVSEGTRKKISIAGQGRVVSAKTKALMSKVRTGEKRSEATLLKMSLAKAGQKYSDKARANMSAGQLGRIHTPERNAKVRAGLTGRKHSDEAKANMSLARLKFLANKNVQGATL